MEWWGGRYSRKSHLLCNQMRYTSADKVTIEMQVDHEGKTVLFDTCFFAKIQPFCWWLDKDGRVKAWMKKREGATCSKMLLHEVILPREAGKQIEYINGNIRDHRQCNLRLVTVQKKKKKIDDEVLLYENRGRWIVSWTDRHNENTRRRKIFSFAPHTLLTKEEAYVAASAFRRDLELMRRS